MKQVESNTGETPSDAELILQVRSGDREAFGVLYERHASAARALARQYVSPADAEDVVADAFSKLFEMLRRGAGPDAGFRPYLYTVVRHRAFDVTRGAARTRPSTDDEIESVLGRVASEDDPALAGFERSVVSKAYFDLPERWREVLWYVLVDDLKPAQVAPVLGLSPNGVSALLYRAKEALRAGYLQQHLTHAPSDTCRTVNPLLGGYVRESLSKRETAKIEEHLATCGTCSALVLELHDVAHGMKTVIAPLVLGAGGLALVGAGAPIGGLAIAAKAGAGAGAAAGGAPAATVSVGAASAGTFSGAVSSAVSATAGAFATAAAAATGGSVAAGAIAVAAVGVVAALQITGQVPSEQLSPDRVITASDGRELPDSEEINGKPVLPTDIEPGDTTTSSYLVVRYTDASTPLAARQPQQLGLTVQNTGPVAATGTQLQVVLPSGLTVARQDGPFGTGVGGRVVRAAVDQPSAGDAAQNADAARGDVTSSPDPTASADTSSGEVQTEPTASPSTPTTVGPMAGDGPSACMPTEQANVVLCSLGEIAPGQSHDVMVTVQAPSGGDYPVATEVWADGLEHHATTLPGRTVAHFGPELSAATRDISLSSPGVAALPIHVTSTGDQPVPAGWSVDVTLPDGVTPASNQPELSCTAGTAQPNVWRCAPRTDVVAGALAPTAASDVALNVTTSTATSAEAPTVLGVANVRPVLQGSGRSASATLVATSAWADAAAGVGKVVASCAAEGGVGTADAVVTGMYTNTNKRPVRVALEAAGSRQPFGKELAPGESATMTVHDGLRVPAGQAAFVLSTDVEGRVYETRVPTADHGQAGCYSPSWDAKTSVEAVNSAGVVTLVGTITNTSDESMFAVMSVPVGGSTMESVSRVVSPGASVNLSVNTGQTNVAAGQATFRLSRDGIDKDGDQPTVPIVSKPHPTASYGAAKIAPARGAGTVNAGVCTFDTAKYQSVHTFTVTADNTGSTLPVLFHVGDTSRTVPGGETREIEFRVPWGAETVDMEAAGKKLETLEVPFESCAVPVWPTDTVSVTMSTQCVGWRVQISAAVENRTGSEWMGVLARENGLQGQAGSEKQIPSGGTTTLQLVRPVAFSGESNVTVRLTRLLEGKTYTVERSFSAPGMMCTPGGEVCEPTSSAATNAAMVTGPGHKRQPPWLRDYEPCDEKQPETKSHEDA